MRSLTDTGASDAGKFEQLAHADGHILIIERAEVATFAAWPDKPKALLDCLDEASGKRARYIGGSARLVMQAGRIVASWNGEPVRVLVRSKRNARYGTVSVWLEDAPPPPPAARVAPPVPSTSPEPTTASAECERLARAMRYNVREWNTARMHRTDEMGHTDWDSLLTDLQALYQVSPAVH